MRWSWVLTALFVAALNAQPSEEELARKSAIAKTKMAEGRFADAAVLYAELVKAVPGNPGLLLNHGMALHLSGRDAEAVPVLQSALKLNPAIPPAQLFLGASLLRLGKGAEALPYLRKFAAADPKHLEVRQMLVDAATLAGRTSEAITHLEKLAELTPDRPAVLYQLGRAYEAAGNAAFAKLEKLFPESGPFFALLGDSRSKSSQSRAAFFFYRKALEKTPQLRGVHGAIAEIYRRTGHPDWAAQEEAAEAAVPALKCTVRSAECEFAAKRFASAWRLAQASESLNALYWRVRAADELARNAFARLAALPESIELYRYQAESAREEGRHAEAVAAWRKALALEPGHPDITRELCASLLAAREYAEAQKLLEPLLAAEPEMPDLNSLQGELLLAQQLPEKAIPYLEKAAKLEPRHLPNRAQLGRALIQAGRGADAIPHLNAALPLDTDGSLHFQLARAYQAAGQAESAKTAMEKYQKIRARSQEQDRVLEEEVKITAPGVKP